MFGSEILDVFIGLFLVYWVFSIMASSVTEILAGMLKQRGAKLKDGIKLLFQGSDDAVNAFFDHPVIKALRPVDGRDKYPSYISKTTFARVYLSMRSELKQNAALAKAVPDSVIAAFGGLVNDSSLQDQVEGWFNEAMDRATGWYKRWSKIIVLAVGALLVVGSNADTISLTNSLWQDPVVREVVVKRAEVVQTENPSDEEIAKSLTRGNDIKDELSSISLLGWVSSNDKDDPRALPSDGRGWVLKIIGLALTTAAIAMGAPFWFDLMGKLLNAKSALAGSRGDGSTARIPAGGGNDNPPNNGSGGGVTNAYHPPLDSNAPISAPAPAAPGPPSGAGTEPSGTETASDTGPPPKANE